LRPEARVSLPHPATKGETYGSADTGHARHLGKRDAGLRRNREKGWFTQPVSKASTIPYDDDHLLFVDMASPQTIANLRNDPRIEINSVDFLRRRGYRFAGTAQVLESGHPIYDWGRDWLLKHHGPEYPTNHVVLIKLQSAEPLMSPAYTFSGRKEEELRATYRKIYGLIPTGHENSA
jgi:uncharacterized protein